MTRQHGAIVGWWGGGTTSPRRRPEVGSQHGITLR